MLISLKWLNKYIDLKDKTVKELENALTMIGQEVEHIEYEGSNLENVITAEIVELIKHPDSDHLTICKVNTGDEILQVICGAPNHTNGDKVVLAKIGAKLSDEFIIKKGKIRGVESYGMLCSEEELKIGKGNDGIIILPKDTEVGIPLKEYLSKDDIIFELEITPNRPDCLSHIGIARELSAYYNLPLIYPKKDVNISIENDKKVEIIGNVSKRYATRIIKNVEVKESPKWLKDSLEAVGVRSINNLVDISNYVMLEYNQPNHIFDLDEIKGNKITVKALEEDIKFITLDDNERELLKGDIVICDEEKPLILAGIMGGKNSEVKDSTKNILIEVAEFSNLDIRRTSRRLSLISESSYRFERGIDEKNILTVMDRITYLINEIAGGENSNIVEEYKEKSEEIVTEFMIPRMNRFIGKNIDKKDIINIFERLEIEIKDEGEKLILKAPSHRKDLINQFDYFEEIIRIYGFDNIENILPKLEMNEKRLENNIRNIQNLKNILSNMGLREVINYSFIPKEALKKINFNNSKIIEIENPITTDFVIMRPTLMYSLLKNAKDNFNRSVNDIKIFEISKVFHLEDKKDISKVNLDDNSIIETQKIAILLGGKSNKDIWAKNEYDFYDLSGIVELLFEKIGVPRYSLERSKNKSYHPNKSADILIGKECLGTFGEIHPDILEEMSIDNNIYYAEIDVEKLQKYQKNTIKYNKISQYQSVNRDIAILVEDKINAGDILKSIKNVLPIIEKVSIFDIYSGKGIKEGYKSVALNIILRDNKTLNDNEINDAILKIVEKLKKQFNAEIR